MSKDSAALKASKLKIDVANYIISIVYSRSMELPDEKIARYKKLDE